MRTQPMVFSSDDKTDVGTDPGTRVSDDYGPETAGSPAASNGSSSTSAKTPTTTTT